jgi:preprotein translocase subunit SecE
MGKTQIKDDGAVEHAAPRDDDFGSRPERDAEAQRRTEERAAGGSPLKIYKQGQGARVRWCSAAGAGLLSLWGASWLFEQLARFPGLADSLTIRYMIPVIVLVGCAVGIFHLVGQNRRVVDFMVATESEIKKVNWSTRREVFGATRVVIVMMLMLGIILFLANLVFIFFFESIGVLRTDMFGTLVGRIFGGGEG